MKRTETIKFGDFMSGAYKEKQKPVKTSQRTNVEQIAHVLKWGAIIPVAGHIATKAQLAFAATNGPEIVAVEAMSGAVKAKIVHAFDPLIELMVGISLPIAGVMLTGGALMIMVGQKDLGFKLIMNSALGYVLVQMSPLFIDLLAGVGSAI